MITKKFDYIKLSQHTTSEGRKYITPDGKGLPSVTTILDYTKTEESKVALQKWRNRVGVEKAKSITMEAAGRGTRMHKFLEKWVLTDTTGEPGSNPYSKQSHSMAQVIVNRGLSRCNEFWGTEINLYFPQVYAGTTDLVGVHDGVESIMDFKQTNKPKKREWIDDYFLQLVAYSLCHNEIYNTSISRGVIFMCSQNNEYQEFILEGFEYKKYVDLWYRRLEQYYLQFV